MIRTIINIDEEKCDGCGICATACHEGAIGMVDGKAKLLKEDFCDGLGDCLPGCPTGAITFEEREAPAYDHAAVLANKAHEEKNHSHNDGGCPGSRARTIKHTPSSNSVQNELNGDLQSELTSWPIQIKLAPLQSPYFDNANLLIAADCSAFTYADFHRKFIRNHVVLIGCPKLDSVDYSEKLTEIIARNNIESVTIVRMEVPCCGGLEIATKKALQASGKFLPWQVVTISTDGRIVDRI
ncbi:MAG: hypothetical protein K0R15_1807 [Clostridiales bacterium]|jgi:ferredoxin|nr:hypothetical protein [Clostridiales bacterium]